MSDIDVMGLLMDYLKSEGHEISGEYALDRTHILFSVTDEFAITDAYPTTRYFVIDNRPIIPAGDVVYVGARVDIKKAKVDKLPGIIAIWNIIRLADPASLPTLSRACKEGELFPGE